jgi:FkbM family methyltransferase
MNLKHLFSAHSAPERHLPPAHKEPPLADDEWGGRIRIAAACRDADDLPRAPRSGEIVEVDGVACQVMAPGVVVVEDCYHGNHMTRLIERLRGVHEPQEEKCFHELVRHVRERPVMLEAGAFWAYYSLWMLALRPGAECHMVEIDRALLDVGIRNFELNRQKGIFTHGGFGAPDLSPWLTEVHGDYVRALPSGKIFFDRPHPTPGFHLNIPLLTLDGYLHANRIDFLDVLHVDIQGEELKLLNGARAALRDKRIGYIFISTHISDAFHAQCLSAVRDADYHIVAEHSISDSFSGDGLIVAKAPSQPGPDRIAISLRSRSGV